VEEAPVAGSEYPLTPGATIGREGCDIVLGDPQVSRRHAAMRRLDSGPAIEDLGSTNGTFVNDERVRGTRPLAAGDTVRFGATVWRLHEVNAGAAGEGWQDASEPATAVKPAAAAAPPPPAPQPAAPPPPPSPAAPSPPPPPPAPRGDVPAPPEVTPSAIRRVLPPPPPGEAPSFQPMPSRGARGSAATRVEATIVCFAIVAATAVALVLYFALYEP
jgi:predicted component of type VI protein secretion system